MMGNGGDLESRGGAGKGRRYNYQNGSYQAPYYVENSESQWTSWLVPMIVVADVAMFIVIMFVNDCPKNNVGYGKQCVAKFLGRLSFQPLSENPLFGPSSST